MTAQETRPVSAGKGDPLVVLSDVQKHFGQLHALKDIDLTVGAGEVVVVIGPSGSGKSTLCRAINRLETIESGTITPAPIERFGFEDAAAAHRRLASGEVSGKLVLTV